MLIVRYRFDNRKSFGILENEKVRELEGSPFEGIKPSSKLVSLSDVQLLAPCTPSKVLSIANNFQSHLADEPFPHQPEPFYKVPTAIIGPGANIVIPQGATRVESEAEMVVVIGKRASRVTSMEAYDYILGVTCGNDVSERIWQRNDMQWWRAKSADTFAPLGPWIATDLNYDDLLVQCRINGEVRQSERTSKLIFNVGAIVSFVSQAVTLLPGDVIFTGTPGEASPLNPGDTVEVEIEHIGTLKNTVVTTE